MQLRNIIRIIVDGVILTESFFHPKIKTVKCKRVLIMRKDGLGDCIIFYPTLSAYRNFYKDAEITLIFPSYFRDLEPLLSKELVDKVIWFNHMLFGSSFLYRRKFLLNLKHAGYDVFIYPVFSRETIGYFMMKMTGAKEKIGFMGDISEHGKRAEYRGTLKYTRLIEPPQEMRAEIMRDVYFAEQITNQKFEMTFPTIDIRKLLDSKYTSLVQKIGLTNKSYAIIFPGAGATYRIWQHQKFAAIINYIQEKGIIPILCGSQKEIDLVNDITSYCKNKNVVINLTGKTDLATLAHLLARATFYFGSDTGILHLAAAVNTPTIGIMGMGGLDRFFPYGDLNKNRVIFDKTQVYETGNWSDIRFLKPGEIHPSIANINVEDAKKEINYIITTCEK